MHTRQNSTNSAFRVGGDGLGRQHGANLCPQNFEVRYNNNNKSQGNRAGLGCLERLRNALSFAVVTEWPVGVYPRRLPGSSPHVRIVRAMAIQPVCVCTWAKIRSKLYAALKYMKIDERKPGAGLT